MTDHDQMGGPLAFLADPMSRWRLVPHGTSRPTYLAVLWVAGGVLLALATWGSLALDLPFRTAVCIYLVIVVMLSLMDSLVSSLIFSIIAVGALNFFFTEPRYTFYVDSRTDVAALITFFLASFVITGLVRRMRNSADTLREQAELLELTHDTVMVRDAGDTITYWNRGAERLYGWGREEAVGRAARELLRTQYPVALEDIKGVLLRDGHWEGELVNTRKDGTPVTVASRWSVQRDEAGRRIGTLETNNDITDRRRAEEALRQSQAAYLAEAQKLSRTGSFGWDTASGEVFWSAQTFDIFEYESGVAPSLDLMMKRVHPEDSARVQSVFERAARDRDNGAFDITYRLLMPDKSVKHLHAAAHPMRDELGRRRFVGALMDVTAAKRAEEQLQQTQAELAHTARVITLGALSASIAHEVNQPLAAIVVNGEACLRWLGREAPPRDQLTSAVNSIISDGKRAGAIVQRVRSLTRKTELTKAELDLNEVIEEVVPLVQREVARHRASLQIETAPTLPMVVGDRIQVQQVLINLIVNGIQAMTAVTDRPRHLTVRSRTGADGDVTVAVEDAGVGINSEDAERIFDAFFTTKADGIGMGLSICRSIIEAHGGQVWAAANGSGPGATFTFRLPAGAGEP
ncbi:MAG TPA: PAS domain-containing protein [Xanthobacteraceae bacterium]|nr:PAS domain-containing protein [Xanthobacteraceae bacterium]